MKQTVILNVSASEYYKAFEDNMIDDYIMSTKEKIHRDDIKPGLTWQKVATYRVGKEVKASIKILIAEKDKEYMIEYQSDKSYRTQHCYITPLEDYKCKIELITKFDQEVWLEHQVKPKQEVDDSEDEKKLTFFERLQYRKLEKGIISMRKSKALN